MDAAIYAKNNYAVWQEELEKLKQEASPANIREHNKKIAKLENKCAFVQNLLNFEQAIAEAKKNAEAEQDQEMRELWLAEAEDIKQKIAEASKKFIDILVPNEKQSVILEIRAGEGGAEAAIFAMELAEMYAKLCKKSGWNFQVFSESYAEFGGLKEGIFEITGNGVEIRLISESGVHCVKRVPKTEKKGRVHTSTATVAILIQPEDVEVVLNEKDLKIDVFRSSGPGGQSVNTTDSAVRITHIPTGIVVSQQDEKSQHKNKEKALKILKARIYEKKLEEAQAKQAGERKQAVGKAKRNERIRTYHFLQNWVKDERVDFMCYNVESFMAADALSLFIESLIWHAIDG